MPLMMPRRTHLRGDAMPIVYISYYMPPFKELYLLPWRFDTRPGDFNDSIKQKLAPPRRGIRIMREYLPCKNAIISKGLDGRSG